jgi:cytochrome c553
MSFYFSVEEIFVPTAWDKKSVAFIGHGAGEWRPRAGRRLPTPGVPHDPTHMHSTVPSMGGRHRHLVAGVLGCLLATAGPATAAPVAAPATIPATSHGVPDTIGQRVAACIACHGREGAIGNGAFYPRLAGKPAGYLYNQLASFRDGRRFNSDMTHLVRHLSDDYLREIAAYFAGLDLPYPDTPSTSDATPATLERGRELALEGDATRGVPACVQCHGAALTGVQPGIPALVGLPRLYLSSQLGAWLTDSRHALPPDCMREVGRRLTTADINAVASWLAIQPVPATAKAVAALPRPLPLPCGSMPRAADARTP